MTASPGLAALQDKRLIIFAGKGGVGKTTCSSATALWLAEHGKRTLVVTVDPAKRLKDSLAEDVGFEPTRVAPNLDAMMMDPRTVVREYVQRKAPEHAEDIFKHDLYKYVSEHMPGLNELLAIGKLGDLREKDQYDVIVVDTAPSGHALNFLSAPRYIKELFEEHSLVVMAIRAYKFYSGLKKAGGSVLSLLKLSKADDQPDIDFEGLFKDIAAEGERINRMLMDESTVLNIVTIPEKLPVEESLELIEKVDALGIHMGVVIVNKVQPDELADLRNDFLKLNQDEDTKEELKAIVAKAGYNPKLMKRVVSTVEFSDLRRQMNLHYLQDLRTRSRVPILEVPLYKEDVAGLPALRAYSRHLFPEAAPGKAQGQAAAKTHG